MPRREKLSIEPSQIDDNSGRDVRESARVGNSFLASVLRHVFQ